MEKKLKISSVISTRSASRSQDRNSPAIFSKTVEGKKTENRKQKKEQIDINNNDGKKQK